MKDVILIATNWANVIDHHEASCTSREIEDKYISRIYAEIYDIK